MNTPFAKHQFKYTFNGSNEDVPVEITFEIDGHTSLSQIIQQFEYYLKACGFYFDGQLDFVNDDLDEPLDWKEIASTIDDDKNEGCMADECLNGLNSTSIPCGSSETKNGCMPNWNDYLKAYNEKIENDKKLKEWNEGIAKLDAEVAKNKWVHGICNPPSPDWKK